MAEQRVDPSVVRAADRSLQDLERVTGSLGTPRRVETPQTVVAQTDQAVAGLSADARALSGGLVHRSTRDRAETQELQRALGETLAAIGELREYAAGFSDKPVPRNLREIDR